MKKVITSSQAPSAIGPYSQAIQVGNTIYLSGQLPIDPASGSMAAENIKAQTRQSLTNIASILKEAGCSMDNVVSTTVLLQSMNDFAAMNEVYAEFFHVPYPARAAFEVAKLPKNALVEITAIAVIE